MQDSDRYFAWQFVAPDRARSLVSIVVTNPPANSAPVHVRLKGLDPEAVYSVNGEFECLGSSLMNSGYTFPRLTGDYSSLQLDVERIK